MAAYTYVQSNNDLFGRIKVNYSVREVETAAPLEPSPEHPDAAQQLIPGNDARAGVADGNGDQQQPLPPLRQSSIKLKSILKKPGEVLQNGGAKEVRRVRFRLEGEKDHKPPPLPMDISGEMMLLLVRCKDIMSNLKTTLGFPSIFFTLTSHVHTEL